METKKTKNNQTNIPSCAEKNIKMDSPIQKSSCETVDEIANFNQIINALNNNVQKVDEQINLIKDSNSQTVTSPKKISVVEKEYIKKIEERNKKIEVQDRYIKNLKELMNKLIDQVRRVNEQNTMIVEDWRQSHLYTPSEKELEYSEKQKEQGKLIDGLKTEIDSLKKQIETSKKENEKKNAEQVKEKRKLEQKINEISKEKTKQESEYKNNMETFVKQFLDFHHYYSDYSNNRQDEGYDLFESYVQAKIHDEFIKNFDQTVAGIGNKNIDTNKLKTTLYLENEITVITKILEDLRNEMEEKRVIFEKARAVGERKNKKKENAGEKEFFDYQEIVDRIRCLEATLEADKKSVRKLKNKKP